MEYPWCLGQGPWVSPEPNLVPAREPSGWCVRKRYPLVSSWKGPAGDLQCGDMVVVSRLGLSYARQHESGPLECAHDGLYVWVLCVWISVCFSSKEGKFMISFTPLAWSEDLSVLCSKRWGFGDAQDRLVPLSVCMCIGECMRGFMHTGEDMSMWKHTSVSMHMRECVLVGVCMWAFGNLSVCVFMQKRRTIPRETISHHPRGHKILIKCLKVLKGPEISSCPVLTSKIEIEAQRKTAVHRSQPGAKQKVQNLYLLSLSPRGIFYWRCKNAN